MEIEFEDIIIMSFVTSCDGEVLETNIEEIARDNGIYDEKYEYVPAVIAIGQDTFLNALYAELIGKEVGAKGTLLLPQAYGERSSEKMYSVDKKKFDKVPKDWRSCFRSRAWRWNRCQKDWSKIYY
jgi:FKBP-type peptidyl-prolyl cis-trans isomerase 2